jgi:class 3 adenylate cyclase
VLRSKQRSRCTCRPRFRVRPCALPHGPRSPDLDTALATILFTDIVGSTERQSALGDHTWKDVIQRHHAIVRDALHRWRGVEIDTAGDGFYATFDGPARAIRCALDISQRVQERASAARRRRNGGCRRAPPIERGRTQLKRRLSELHEEKLAKLDGLRHGIDPALIRRPSTDYPRTRVASVTNSAG